MQILCPYGSRKRAVNWRRDSFVIKRTLRGEFRITPILELKTVLGVVRERGRALIIVRPSLGTATIIAAESACFYIYIYIIHFYLIVSLISRE